MFLRIIATVALACLASEGALADHFNVADLPVGADVTLPGAAYALVPMSARVKVSSTDHPQTIRIAPVSVVGMAPTPVQVSIFDAHQDRVRYVKVAPGAPFLYSFRGLSTITVHGDLVQGSEAQRQSIMLKIESDKPLTVAR